MSWRTRCALAATSCGWAAPDQALRWPGRPGEQKELTAEQPIAYRFIADAMGLWMAYQGQWKKLRWGVASNQKPEFAADPSASRCSLPIDAVLPAFRPQHKLLGGADKLRRVALRAQVQTPSEQVTGMRSPSKSNVSLAAAWRSLRRRLWLAGAGTQAGAAGTGCLRSGTAPPSGRCGGGCGATSFDDVIAGEVAVASFIALQLSISRRERRRARASGGRQATCALKMS